MDWIERCGCGRPLHYPDPGVEARVRRQVEDLGVCVTVSLGRRSWLVPRHYIALHGLSGAEVDRLALEHGWEEVE